MFSKQYQLRISFAPCFPYFKDRAGLLPGILPTDPCDGDLTDPELDEVSWLTTTNGWYLQHLKRHVL